VSRPLKCREVKSEQGGKKNWGIKNESVRNRLLKASNFQANANTQSFNFAEYLLLLMFGYLSSPGVHTTPAVSATVFLEI